MPNHLFTVLFKSDVPLNLALVSLGMALFDASRTPMLEAAVCARWYRRYDISVIGPDGLVPEKMCKGNNIQAEVASINGGYVYAGALGALLLAMPYAWLATKLEKQMLVLIGAASTAAQYVCFYAICRFTHWDVRFVWSSTLFDAIGGGTRITYIMLWSLITDATQPQLRSSVFFAISSSLLLVQFLGMAASGYLLQTSPWTVGLIASLVYALNVPVLLVSFLRSSFKSRRRDPGEGDRQRLWDPSENVEIPDASEEPKISLLKAAANNIQAWLKLVYHHFFQHVTFQLAFLMHGLVIIAMGIEIILQQWVSRTFTWSLANTTYTLAYTMFVSFFVLASLPAINARLRPRFKDAQAMDFSLVWWNLLIRAFGACVLGFSRGPYVYIPSLTIYTLGVGLYDSIKALLTSFAPEDRITELFTALMMLEQVMSMISSLIWPRIFTGTLAASNIWKGLPFLLCSVCYLSAFVILTRIGRYIRN